MPTIKVARIISPFIYKNGELIDKRGSDLYDFVHDCNGSSVEDIESDYDRFVSLINAGLAALDKINNKM